MTRQVTIGDIVVSVHDPLGLGTGVIVDIGKTGLIRVVFDTDDAYADWFAPQELELASVWEKAV